jgi:hypothetical protein
MEPTNHTPRELAKHYMEKALSNIEHMTGKHPVTEDEQKDFAYEQFAWGDEKETALTYEFLELVFYSAMCKVLKGE